MSSEWRGPWKCEKCGSLWIGNMTGACPQSYGPFTSSASPTECGGHLIPYERRKDDALAAMTRERDEESEQCCVYAEELGKMWALRDQAERERDALREELSEAVRLFGGGGRPIHPGRPAREFTAWEEDYVAWNERARAALKEGGEK